MLFRRVDRRKMPPMGERRHLLISGLPRSGTTLVTNVFNALEGVTVWSDLLRAPIYAARQFGGFSRPLDERGRNVALWWLNLELGYMGRRSAISRADFSTLEEFYRLVLDEVALPDDVVVGHKVPSVGPEQELFQQLLTQTALYCIVVVRDARDVFLSQSNAMGDGLSSPEEWF